MKTKDRRKLQDSFVAPSANEVTIVHRDSTKKASVVVEHCGELWLVPNTPDGWKRRLRLSMTDEAKRERLTPADVDPQWLGIPAE